MKQISLFILLAIAGMNACGAMECVYASRSALMQLQPRATLFFDRSDLYASQAQLGQENFRLIKASKSDEINDIAIEMHQIYLSKQLTSLEKATRGKTLEQRQNDVLKKIKDICERIAKKLNACCVLSWYSDAKPLLSHSVYVDLAYDITQEVFDTLNSEYNKKKPQKSTCNQSCCVHCPLKNTQH